MSKTAKASEISRATAAPGDAIRYVADINNSSGKPTKVILAFISAGPIGPNAREIYRLAGNITLPSGRSFWYGQSTIPQDTMAGKYVVAAGVQATEGRLTAKGTFTVTSRG